MRLDLTLGLGLALVVTSGCEDPRGPLDLDDIAGSDQACVTVVHEALEVGGPIHRFVSDAPNSSGGWALTSLIDDNTQLLELVVVRVPASADEGPTPIVDLGFFTPDPKTVELRAGTKPGEAWLLSQSGGGVALRRLLPKFGLVASNGMLGNFPVPDEGDECPTAHSRSLLLSDGRPYLLAIPDCSDDPSLEFGLLALDPVTLEFSSSWVLNFDPRNDSDPIGSAQQSAYWLPLISAGGSALLPDASRTPIGFTQKSELASSDPPIDSPTAAVSDVCFLDMRITASGPTARLVTLEDQWSHTVPVELGLVSITQDPYSIQLHVRNNLRVKDALLLRFDTVDDLFIPIRDPLPFEGQGRLVQLADQGIMLEVRDGVLRAVPLIDVDTWFDAWIGSGPAWRAYDLLELPDLVDFEVSGVGQLLLRREDAPPQVVHITCIE